MDRRTKEGYKLRVYIDEIKRIKAMPIEQWIEIQASFPSNEPYLSKDKWLSYLEGCAILEAEQLIRTEAA